jgi:nucleoside-diphosphate kinase
MFKLLLATFLALASIATISADPSPVQENKQITPLNQKMQIPQETLLLIKPDAFYGHHIGEIIARLEKNRLNIAAIKMTHLSKERAQQFYAEHKERPFFDSLTTYMSSGPIVAIVLQGPNAVKKTRKIIGETDPKKAAAGTIRADFGKSTAQNAVHASDSPEKAKTEILFFFTPEDITSPKKPSTSPRK